jgi:hypothetical protein
MTLVAAVLGIAHLVPTLHKVAPFEIDIVTVPLHFITGAELIIPHATITLLIVIPRLWRDCLSFLLIFLSGILHTGGRLRERDVP